MPSKTEQLAADPANCVDLWGLCSESDIQVFGGNLPSGVLPIITTVPEGSGFLGQLASFALQGLAGLYNIGANLVNNAANVVSYINDGIDSVCQTLFGATTDEILMTMQANGILIPAQQQIDSFFTWISSLGSSATESNTTFETFSNFLEKNGVTKNDQLLSVDTLKLINDGKYDLVSQLMVELAQTPEGQKMLKEMHIFSSVMISASKDTNAFSNLQYLQEITAKI